MNKSALLLANEDEIVRGEEAYKKFVTLPAIASVISALTGVLPGANWST